MDPPTTTFTRHRTGVYLSRTTLVVITAIVFFCLCGTGVLLYHFLQCHSNSATPVCDLNHHKHHPQPLHNESDPSVTQMSDDASHDRETRDLSLPKSVRPVRYDLKFIPFLENGNFTYKGSAKIHVNVTESCKNITMHSKALKIDKDRLSVRLMRDGGKVEVRSQSFVEEKQFFIIELEEELKSGEMYEINMEFEGMLNDDLEGFYKSSYQQGNNTR